MAKQSVTVSVDRELAEGEALLSEADLSYWDQLSDACFSDQFGPGSVLTQRADREGGGGKLHPS